MIINYRDKCIFFHVPKAAGRSIQFVLKQRLMVRLELGYNCLEGTVYGFCSGTEDKGFVMSHVRPRELKEELRGDFGRQIFDGFYKFAFVRNSWDRMVALYHFYRQNCENTKEFNTPFGEWVKYLHGTHIRGEWEWNTISQHEWTHIDGEQVVDFIGRYENLQSDFEHVKEVLALPDDCQLPHRNKSNHKDYWEYYTNETRQMVGDMFADDIALFNYNFEGQE